MNLPALGTLARLAAAGAPQSDVPPPARIREASRAILESSEFRFGPAQPDNAFWPWLLKKLGDLFGSLGSLGDSPLGWVVLVICGVLLAAIIVYAAASIVRAYRKSRSREPETAILAPRKQRASEILRQARAAAARGDVAEALTLYLRAVIVGLDQRGIARTLETVTVREYLGLLRAHPQERGLFEEFLAYYEPGVFGRRALGPEPMSACDRIAGRLAGESA